MQINGSQLTSEMKGHRLTSLLYGRQQQKNTAVLSETRMNS